MSAYFKSDMGVCVWDVEIDTFHNIHNVIIANQNKDTYW